MRVQSAQPTDTCTITSVRAVLRSLSQISPFFMPKEKFYDNNSTDLSQEVIARPQLYVLTSYEFSGDLCSRFQCYVLLAKATSFDLLSTCHLSTCYVNG